MGTARRALAAAAAGHYFVAPDNGLLSFLPPDAQFVSLPIPANAAPTFHGRDVFAPAAGQLALGASLKPLAHAITDPHLSPLPAPREDGGVVLGEVIYVDRFGTLISNLPSGLVRPTAHVTVGGSNVGTLRRTFADVERGQVVAFAGSNGTVEIAVRDGSAAEKLSVRVGVEVRTVEDGQGRTKTVKE